MGCDPALDLQPYTSSVSIHAPTWGATSRWVRPARVFRFQSTHPRGVRLVELFPIAPNHSFNPRTHVGCDLPRPSTSSTALPFQSTHPRRVRRCYGLLHDACGVSIHAPTQGATSRSSSTGITASFNPRTHAGCDWLAIEYCCALLSFNPRTHAGCDCRWWRQR